MFVIIAIIICYSDNDDDDNDYHLSIRTAWIFIKMHFVSYYRYCCHYFTLLTCPLSLAVFSVCCLQDEWSMRTSPASSSAQRSVSCRPASRMWLVVVDTFSFCFCSRRHCSTWKGPHFLCQSLTLSLRMATARVSPPYVSTPACGTPCRRMDFGVVFFYFFLFCFTAIFLKEF